MEVGQGPERKALAPVSLQREIDFDPLNACNLCPRRDQRHVARVNIPKQEIVEVHTALCSLDCASGNGGKAFAPNGFLRLEWGRNPKGKFRGEVLGKRTAKGRAHLKAYYRLLLPICPAEAVAITGTSGLAPSPRMMNAAQ